ncbi:hypothetical protein Anapl_00758 [Anas platyrhynchos]|uniref:Uncharacterized protein n=1 Tax=Anas platyrhynchos TaxID=8839 RepID=R0LJA0_ANAPL|nr:hypothetical protein Anapl_00758 [Anas platyrhynchos]
MENEERFYFIQEHPHERGCFKEVKHAYPGAEFGLFHSGFVQANFYSCSSMRIEMRLLWIKAAIAFTRRLLYLQKNVLQTSGDPDQRVQQAEFLMKQRLAGQEGKLGGQHLNSMGPRSPWERQLSPPSGCERWNNLSRSKGKLERDVGE